MFDLAFGPFVSAYHNGCVTLDFQNALAVYLVGIVPPQVDRPFVRAAGTVTAAYDDDRHCGARSAVRDIYRLDLTLYRPSGDDFLRVDLIFDPRSSTFRPRRGHAIYSWTVARRTAYARETRAIRDTCGALGPR